MMSQKENDSMWARPARVELGCQARGQCFCTGRCRRTAEEQAAYEEMRSKLYQQAVVNGIGRQHFEPKPGHGPAPAAEPANSWESPGQEFEPEPASALDTQVGGDHYKKLGDYQPWSVLKAWLTPEEFRGYMKGTAIAYLARERDKGGDQDVQKAAHTLQGLVEMSDFREVGK